MDYGTNILWILLMALFVIQFGTMAKVNDLKRIERKLDKVLEELEVGSFSLDYLDEDERNEILSLLDNGEKIQAIKALRKYTGMDLKEAKEFIDQI